MLLSELMNIEPGVISVIGSGGKTTLIGVLADELSQKGKHVIVLAASHALPHPLMKVELDIDSAELDDLLLIQPVVALGSVGGDGRLTFPSIPIKQLMDCADYILVEADNSMGFPLKAHRLHEPRIPAESGRTICVAGLSGIGRHICDAAHRSDIFAAHARLEEEDTITPEALARVIKREAIGDSIFLNQLDTIVAPGIVERVRNNCGYRSVFAGSLRRGEWQRVN